LEISGVISFSLLSPRKREERAKTTRKTTNYFAQKITA
jgi:hypothetical protein